MHNMSKTTAKMTTAAIKYQLSFKIDRSPQSTVLFASKSYKKLSEKKKNLKNLYEKQINQKLGHKKSYLRLFCDVGNHTQVLSV